ncbi:MAG: hypothetical protein ACLRHW_20375 [Coprobacillus cateniformis]
MLLKRKINKYLNCKFQKELNDKTIKAYKADWNNYRIGENNPDKETLIHISYNSLYV